MSLYSDAHLNQLKEIDWPNKFEKWINETEQIYNVSDKIYTDPNVHDFWAWKMQAYLQQKWTATFADYEVTSFVDSEFDALTTSSHIASSNCEVDRELYCPSLFVNFSYNSDLYACLEYNFANLATDCQSYIRKLKVENINNSTSIAKQVQVIALINSSVSGLYVAPSTDLTNVFYKYTGNGVLYQRNDNTWRVLDDNYDLIFYSDETEDGSEPPQYGWYTPDGDLAPVSTVYYDDTYKSYYRDPSVFLSVDVDAPTVFNTSYYFQSSGKNKGGCYAFEAMQLAMQDTYSFSSISLTSSAGRPTSCSAVLESSNLCRGIADGKNVGNLTCGTYEKVPLHTTWWIGSCTDENYTVVAGNQTSSFEISQNDACNCRATVNTSLSSPKTVSLNYLSPCSFDNHNWGFSNGTSTTCDAESQQITLSCNVLDSCNTLKACFQEVSTFTHLYDYCTANSIEIYSRRGQTAGLAQCLLRQYNSLSSCCQTAVDVEIIDRYTCANISEYSLNDGSVCTLKDSCDANCSTICYGSIIADCNNEISSDCYSAYQSGNSAELYDCLTNLTSISTCCSEQLNTSVGTSCIITPNTYYDFSTKTYNYSNCKDDWPDIGCGSAYNGTTAQLNCLLNAINLTIDNYCCYTTLELITPSYIFTRDCQGDTYEHCNKLNAASVTSSCLTTLGLSDLSPNCNATLYYCPEDGDWPRTYINTTANISCQTTYGGYRTRLCTVSKNIATWSSVINEDSCYLLSCAADIDSKGQHWASSYVGYVQHYLGSREVNSNYSGNGLCLTYLQRFCDFNTENNTAYWRSPVYWCRNSYNTWSDPLNGSYCNPDSASLIEAYDASSLGDVEEQQASCRTLCLSTLSHCVGYLYDRNTSTCYFYDYCELETSLNRSVISNLVFWYAPETLSEEVATYCSSIASSHGLSLKPSAAYSSNGIPNVYCFNLTLFQYLLDPAGGVLYQDKFVLNDASYLYEGINGLARLQIKTTYNQISVKDLTDTSTAVTFINDIRNWLDTTMYSNGLYVIPGGLIINLFSEYVNIETYLMLNLIYIGIAITIVSYLFLLNVWAVFVLMVCNIAMTVEVYGFLDWASLEVNGVFILNIIVAVGTTFIFSAHMGRAFIITTVRPEDHVRSIAIPYATDGQIRMKKTLREMFSPVSLGALTTFIGILPIVGSTFPYFTQYYFILYLLILIFGWVNGVIFQAVFLSWFPPTPFLEIQPQKDSVSNLGPSIQLMQTADTTGGSSIQLMQTADSTGGTSTTDVENQARTTSPNN